MQSLDIIRKLNLDATLGSYATQDEVTRYLEQEKEDQRVADRNYENKQALKEQYPELDNGISPIVEVLFSVDTVPTTIEGPSEPWPRVMHNTIAAALGEPLLREGRHDRGRPKGNGGIRYIGSATDADDESKSG